LVAALSCALAGRVEAPTSTRIAARVEKMALNIEYLFDSII
jgi:hypothetical protein